MPLMQCNSHAICEASRAAIVTLANLDLSEAGDPQLQF
jgi:hypothetical protein